MSRSPAHAACALKVAPLLLTMLLGCSVGPDLDDEAAHAAASPAPKSATSDGQATVNLSADQRQELGLAVEVLAPASRARSTTLFGRVLSIQDLADLRQSLAAASSSLTAAEARAETAAAELRRLEGLFADRANVSQRQVEEARAVAADSHSTVTSARATLEGRRAAAVQSWGPELARSLEVGGEPAAALLSFRTIPVLVSSGAAGPPTAPATASVAAGGIAAPARFISALPHSEGPVQGSAWLYAASAQPGTLPAGLNVEVEVEWGETRSGVEVPREAVVRWNGVLWVYVEQGPENFRRLPLANPEPAPAGWFITSGLVPDDRLVTTGAQALFSEELKSAAPSAELD